MNKGGAGVIEWGNIGLMPVNRIPDVELLTNYGFRSRFKHDTEKAYPGYYSVFLETWNIYAELTSTKYVNSKHKKGWNTQIHVQ
jgi:putative alpha-1,2-mannosidase